MFVSEYKLKMYAYETVGSLVEKLERLPKTDLVNFNVKRASFIEARLKGDRMSSHNVVAESESWNAVGFDGTDWTKVSTTLKVLKKYLPEHSDSIVSIGLNPFHFIDCNMHSSKVVTMYSFQVLTGPKWGRTEKWENCHLKEKFKGEKTANRISKKITKFKQSHPDALGHLARVLAIDYPKFNFLLSGAEVSFSTDRFQFCVVQDTHLPNLFFSPNSAGPVAFSGAVGLAGASGAVGLVGVPGAVPATSASSITLSGVLTAIDNEPEKPAPKGQLATGPVLNVEEIPGRPHHFLEITHQFILHRLPGESVAIKVKEGNSERNLTPAEKVVALSMGLAVLNEPDPTVTPDPAPTPDPATPGTTPDPATPGTTPDPTPDAGASTLELSKIQSEIEALTVYYVGSSSYIGLDQLLAKYDLPIDCVGKIFTASETTPDFWHCKLTSEMMQAFEKK